VPSNAKQQQPNPMASTFQNVQQAAGGVKFGSPVVFTGEATCDTAQNASALSDVIKLLINMAQMQTGQDPTAAALVKSVTVTPKEKNVVMVSASLSEEVVERLLESKKPAAAAHRLPAHKKELR
jgi:hypothetical protein